CPTDYRLLTLAGAPRHGSRDHLTPMNTVEHWQNTKGDVPFSSSTDYCPTDYRLLTLGDTIRLNPTQSDLQFYIFFLRALFPRPRHLVALPPLPLQSPFHAPPPHPKSDQIRPQKPINILTVRSRLPETGEL